LINGEQLINQNLNW